MREWYGSFVPNLLGRTITPNEVTPWFAAVTSAIEQFEPRYRVTRIQIVEVTRDGRLHSSSRASTGRAPPMATSRLKARAA